MHARKEEDMPGVRWYNNFAPLSWQMSHFQDPPKTEISLLPGTPGIPYFCLSWCAAFSGSGHSPKRKSAPNVQTDNPLGSETKASYLG